MQHIPEATFRCRYDKERLTSAKYKLRDCTFVTHETFVRRIKTDLISSAPPHPEKVVRPHEVF